MSTSIQQHRDKHLPYTYLFPHYYSTVIAHYSYSKWVQSSSGQEALLGDIQRCKERADLEIYETREVCPNYEIFALCRQWIPTFGEQGVEAEANDGYAEAKVPRTLST